MWKKDLRRARETEYPGAIIFFFSALSHVKWSMSPSDNLVSVNGYTFVSDLGLF